MSVAAEREEPTIEIARAQVGMDRPPRKNSSVSDLLRLSRQAAARPIRSMVAMYAARMAQSRGPKAARMWRGARDIDGGGQRRWAAMSVGSGARCSCA